MSIDDKIVHTAQGWFVETAEGRVGPLDSRDEALSYLALLQVSVAAGSEIACTDQECFS